MSQWSGLNIHVIKTKRIECTKLNLPDVLTKPQSCPPSKHKKASLNSTSDSSPSQRGHSSHSSIAESLPIELEDTLSPLKTPEADEVFECTFETASEDSVNHRNVITRCLSLPCLSCERNIAKDSSVCRQRLSHEAFNLESPLSDIQSRLVREASEGFWTGFPRDQDSEECESLKDIGMKRSITPHAERMNRTDTVVLIADSNNNNSSSCDYKRGVNPSTLGRAKSSLELRQDWEQKILGLTSGSTFGAERVENRKELSRPRSVTLTGNLHNLVGAQNQTTKNRDSERRTKSEGKQKMPKLQSVVWDYIKRRSTKRKSKRDSQSKGNSNAKESKKTPSKENYEKNNQTTSSGNQGLGNGPVKNYLESDNRVSSPSSKGGKISRNKSWSYSNSTKAPGCLSSLARWKSAPSLKYSEPTESIPQLRKNSVAEVPSQKAAPKLRVKELEDDPEILKLLLTTSPEERPMEERLKTLMLSREWLLKELQSMREEDRRLARQFINLRSAIVEIRQAREKEESDYDSEGEGHKTRLIDSQKLAVEKKGRKTRERTLQMHVTPTRNILSYC